MDYTSFVRHYYVTLINKLNQFHSYKGATTILNYPLDVPEENLYNGVENQFDGLPSFSVNINAPYSDFENFGNVMPDLVTVMPSKDVLREIYSKYVFNKNDGNEEERIEILIEMFLNDLKEQGIIE